MAEKASGAAFAATWRDDQGKVVGTTWGGTMCLWPRKPWRIRIARDGFEHVIRCGECPGCLEFDRRRLADRLWRKYGARDEQGRTDRSMLRKNHCDARRRSAAPLFVARIYAPIDAHAAMSHALHRRRGLQLEPGMWRLGATSFALLSREVRALREALRKAGVKHRIEPLRLGRGRRAFRVLTAGLLVAREIYGEQVNRWYARGLPPAARERWEVQKIAKYQSYDRARSPRAFTARRVVLLPPDVWKLPRPDRVALCSLLRRQADPEGVSRVMGLVADVIGKAGRALDVSGAAKRLLPREGVVRWYQEHARRSRERTDVTGSDQNVPPLSEAGGYVSSGHKQGELMPLELARARSKEWEERRKQRAIKESMEIIERMRRKAGGRGGDDDRNGGTH